MPSDVIPAWEASRLARIAAGGSHLPTGQELAEKARDGAKLTRWEARKLHRFQVARGFTRFLAHRPMVGRPRSRAVFDHRVKMLERWDRGMSWWHKRFASMRKQSTTVRLGRNAAKRAARGRKR
jgi:hypothetical protein